jgi:hypothetical protein
VRDADAAREVAQPDRSRACFADHVDRFIEKRPPQVPVVVGALPIGTSLALCRHAGTVLPDSCH